MECEISAVGIELIVADLDRSIELFVEVLGGELITRGASELVSGETAVIDANGVMISLLQPAPSGPSHVLADRTPRLSQLIFATASNTDVEIVRNRSIEAGLATSLHEHQFHITAESIEGALGIGAAIVVTHVPTS